MIIRYMLLNLSGTFSQLLQLLRLLMPAYLSFFPHVQVLVQISFLNSIPFL